MKTLLISLLLAVLMACSDTGTQINAKQTSNEKQHSDELLADTSADESRNKEMLEPTVFEAEGYKFEAAYVKYNEDVYGFQNPGVLSVKRDGKTLYTDSFKGEGQVYIKNLGQHNLSGNKLFFTLNYGTEACDYISTSKYYVVFDNKRIQHLGSFISQSGGDGYASRFYEHVFPEDSSGRPNMLLFVEGLMFHEHDQPDLYDTTRIIFDNSSFVIKKESNNLEKAK